MTALPETERYRRAIPALPPGPLRLDDVRSRAFLRFQDTRLAIYYAPFDYVNTNARPDPDNKLFFRARGPWAEFFRRHGLRAGDHVVIERLATDEYLVRPDH